MFKGWIYSQDPDIDGPHLESLGVSVVTDSYNTANKCFEECSVPDEVLTQTLDRHWGRYFWGLERTKSDN